MDAPEEFEVMTEGLKSGTEVMISVPYNEARAMHQEDSLERLTSMGFVRVGKWKLIESNPIFELSQHASAQNVLYAFVVDGQLHYIGKTVVPLRKRMAGYKNPGKSQLTNVRNNDNIRASLTQGKLVEIYALPDNGLLYYGGFHVNLAAGLEDSLVRELSPPWNGGRKESPNQTLEPIAPELTLANYMSPERFPKTTQANLTAKQQFILDAQRYDLAKDAMASDNSLTEDQQAVWEELQTKIASHPKLLPDVMEQAE